MYCRHHNVDWWLVQFAVHLEFYCTNVILMKLTGSIRSILSVVLISKLINTADSGSKQTQWQNRRGNKGKRNSQGYWTEQPRTHILITGENSHFASLMNETVKKTNLTDKRNNHEYQKRVYWMEQPLNRIIGQCNSQESNFDEWGSLEIKSDTRNSLDNMFDQRNSHEFSVQWILQRRKQVHRRNRLEWSWYKLENPRQYIDKYSWR